MIKTNKDTIWEKAIVLEKAKEPRSYWVRKERNNKIVRRNTSQMKLSVSKSDRGDRILEPELYPDHLLSRKPSNSLNVTRRDDYAHDLEHPDVLIEHLIDAPVSNKQDPLPGSSGGVKSRFGRRIKPLDRLNL